VPPPIALALTLLLIAYLLHRDSREAPHVSSAVWIPTIWLLINGSRQVSQWLGGDHGFSAQALEEGNPIDKAVYGALIVAGISVLVNRRVRFGEFAKNNLWIMLFLLYGALSILWSDFPLVSFKRWVKALGDPLMVLVLLSDPHPVRAIMSMIRRCAYVLIPLSLLFCKYYENLGRNFDAWGTAAYTGATLDKNMFGYLLFAFGLFFVASFVSGLNTRGERRTLSDQMINLVLVLMVAWLIPLANSKTSTLALAAGVAVVVALQFPTVRKHVWFYVPAALVIALAADELFSVKSAVLEASGRDPTFTGRTGLWETLVQEPINPLLGVGYASFWLGERLQRFWAMYTTSPPIQAHNGYLEIYVNLGLIGVLLIAGVLWTGLRRAGARVRSSSRHDGRDEAIFRTFGFAYAVAYLLYNVTEATFAGLNPLFLIFLTVAFSYRHERTHIASRVEEPKRSRRIASLKAP
jgi:O-antigen ligase